MYVKSTSVIEPRLLSKTAASAPQARSALWMPPTGKHSDNRVESLDSQATRSWARPHRACARAPRGDLIRCTTLRQVTAPGEIGRHRADQRVEPARDHPGVGFGISPRVTSTAIGLPLRSSWI